jgi:hypothetical protein
MKCGQNVAAETSKKGQISTTNQHASGWPYRSPRLQRRQPRSLGDANRGTTNSTYVSGDSHAAQRSPLAPEVGGRFGICQQIFSIQMIDDSDEWLVYSYGGLTRSSTKPSRISRIGRTASGPVLGVPDNLRRRKQIRHLRQRLSRIYSPIQSGSLAPPGRDRGHPQVVPVRFSPRSGEAARPAASGGVIDRLNVTHCARCGIRPHDRVNAMPARPGGHPLRSSQRSAA